MNLEQLIQAYLQIITRGTFPQSFQARQAALNRLILLINRELRLNGSGYDNRDYSFGDWKKLHEDILLAGFIVAGMLANQGQEEVGLIDIEEPYVVQMDQFEQFARQVRERDLQTAGRSSTYAKSVRTGYYHYGGVFWAGFGFDLWSSRTRPAEHCSECIAEEAKAPRPLNQIIPIGERLCNTGCNCYLVSVTEDGSILL